MGSNDGSGDNIEEPRSENLPGIDTDLPSDSACENAFYPVNQERIWTYQTLMVGTETTEFTIATTDMTEDTLTSTMTFPDFSTTAHWTCSEEGLTSSEFTQFNLAMLPGYDIENISMDGVTLPDEDLWEIGYTWESSYEIAVNLSIQGLSLDTVVNATFDSEITRIEEVTVPAGTYPEAYRVDMTGTIKLNIMNTAMDVPLEASTWYVRNIGMVKSVSTSLTGVTTLELISIE